MLAVSIDTSEFDRQIRALAELPDTIRKVVVGAVSDTVDDVHARQSQEMEFAFDRPTPYVKRGLKKMYPTGRTGRHGQGVERAGTYFEFFGGNGMSPEEVIKPHVFGGPRRRKSFERRLEQVVGGGFHGIMGNAFPRNKHGNITGARYTHMLSQLGTIQEARPGQKRRKTAAGVSFFVSRRNGVPTAIVERRGKRTTVMIALTRKTPQYRKRYRFFEVGEQQVSVSLPRHFNRILRRYADRL